MKSIVICLVAILFSITASAQEQPNTISVTLPDIPGRDTTSYPEGVYATVEDFMAKKPSNPIAHAPIYPENFFGGKPDNAPEVCFFYYKYGQETKIKAFAISYKGFLYFQIKHMLRNKEKGGRSEDHLNPNMFVQVIVEGPQYIYTESEFGNAWAMGLAANQYGGNMRGSYERIGVAWDHANKVFHIFKFCEDFNEFITPIKPEFAQQCNGKKRRPDLAGMRHAFAALKPDVPQKTE
jgi:hypothetical protein